MIAYARDWSLDKSTAARSTRGNDDREFVVENSMHGLDKAGQT